MFSRGENEITMNDYDLSSISPVEFEELCCDVLSVKFGAEVKNGKSGKDSGIDGIFRIGDKRIVVQAKHYLLSSYTGLRAKLLKSEVFKARAKVVSYRYILMTSCELSDSNRREIVKIYGGIIKDERDVWSGADIRAELAKPGYEWVRKRHYNLWLKGIDALEEFLGNGIVLKSKAILFKMSEDLRHSVRTELLKAAYNKLCRNKVIVVIGQAGTGKTTLAQQLVMDSVLGDGYGFVASDADFSVCDRELALHSKEKTLFFIDDFLGANCLEALTNKKDSKIVGLIWRVKNNENCRLILSSRTNIINEAIDRYRVFDNSNIESLFFQMDNSRLGRIDRARMLYSLMYFGDVDKNSKDCVVKDENYFKIIDHRNFNPRIVSYCFMSKFADNILRSGGRLGIERILWMLDNPSEIWRDCIISLNSLEMYIVKLVFLVSMAETTLLEKTYERLLKRDAFAAFREIPFIEIMRKLCMSVLSSAVIERNEERSVAYQLFNPSVGDYIVANCQMKAEAIADLALLYQDVDISSSLWKEFISGFGERTPYRMERMRAGKIILHRLKMGIIDCNVNFILGNFKELVDYYGTTDDVKRAIGVKIGSDGIVFFKAANPSLVATYLHWAFDNYKTVLDDVRLTKPYLDGLFSDMTAAKAILMLHRVYLHKKYALPNDYFQKIKDAASEWADEIAQSEFWDVGTSADMVWEFVTGQMSDFMTKCLIHDDILNCAGCCDSFEPDAYATDDCDDQLVDVEAQDSSLSKSYEDKEIRRIFNAQQSKF